MQRYARQCLIDFWNTGRRPAIAHVDHPSYKSEHPMHRATRASAAFLATAVALPAATASAQRSQQADLSISPFVSFLPSAGMNPMAGLALTVAGGAGFGLRASGHLALDNENSTGLVATNSARPWGADADAVFSIGGRGFGSYGRAFAPFVFVGIGTGTSDSTASNVLRSNWSYGAGATIPLGSAIALFGESRWRMSRYVLPTATLAPSPTAELRMGLSFHVGNSGTDRDNSRRGRGREREVGVVPPSSPAAVRDPATANANGAALVGIAQRYVGTPYRFGGNSPTTGFDGAGFVQYVFWQQGVWLPRTSREQARVGSGLSPDWRAVSAGDLVLFEENGQIEHVAIYAGGNRIIHSTASGGGVRYDDLSTQRGAWFIDHMVAVRRVTPDARGGVTDFTARFASTIAAPFDRPDHAPTFGR
jgi:cell wall-associated NlpC family hydrolase